MFGDAGVRAYGLTVEDQRQALMRLALLSRRSVAHPLIWRTAKRIRRKCPGRDDECELTSLFYAVKNGDPSVPGLQYGVRYMADPVLFDAFTAPYRLLELGIELNTDGGAPAFDCDDHAALIAALAGAMGFRSGVRAYAPQDARDFDHVYAVVGLPKNSPREWFGMDTTVPRAYPGWEPPPGKVLTVDVAAVGESI